ncbi:MAG: helix-turn-helix transcriptional regulator [Rhodoferax sp.]|nr:helix-turn-helix transcriptional regulator [Rhodoferax sp.]
MKYKKVDFKIVVGKQVKRLRLKAGMTQDVLSERCGIYRTYLSRVEAGSANPTLLILEALSTTLDVHIRELFEEVVAEEGGAKRASATRRRSTKE